MVVLMTDYCFFTIEHVEAKSVYIRGLMDITEPIDDFKEIIRFGEDMSRNFPPNPFKKGEKEFKLYEELVSAIKADFDEICHELVFAKTIEEQDLRWDNHLINRTYYIEYEKIII